MTFAIHTFGCKVNLYESEYITSYLKDNNYILKSFEEEADIYIINTCTVTNEADKKDRKLINVTRKKHPKAILIVMGCYSQLKPNEINADIIIGNKYKSHLIELINEFQNTKKQIIKVEDIKETTFEDMFINKFESHTRAFVKIQDGCNAFCTYCTIPYARGGLRSKKFSEVIKEIKELVANGYQEVVLTGIHTGRYGLDINTNLETLLKELVKIEGLLRIRLSSIEINEITDEIINLIKTNDKMAKHLHIPIQSGSNTILENMNRHYNKEYFIDRVAYIKETIPDISITTDLIVGFPGENDELFSETLDTIKKINFTKIHTFPYSKRNGTVAADMPNQVDETIKKCRVREIINISNQNEEKFYKQKINSIYDGVVENRKEGKSFVVTTNYIPVEIDESLSSNTKVKIIIDNVQGLEAHGKLVR